MSSTTVFEDVCYVFTPLQPVVDYLYLQLRLKIMFEIILRSINKLHGTYVIWYRPEQKGLDGHTLIEHHNVVSEKINNNDFILCRLFFFY